MHDLYYLPKDSTAYPISKQHITINKYYETPEFKRWFAKWVFSSYLLLAIITPLLWIFAFGFTNILDVILILCIQIVCIVEMLYVFAYSFDEIEKFLKNGLRGYIDEGEKQNCR